MAQGIITKIEDKFDIHSKLKWVWIKDVETKEEERYSIFGSLKDFHEGDEVNYEPKEVIKNGNVYYNLKSLKRIPQGEQKHLPSKSEEKSAGKGLSVSSQKVLDEILQEQKNIRDIMAKDYDEILACQNMLGSIIEALPGVGKKKKETKS